ncbi:MAG: hypothetical protein NC483_01145, partial [Ruminococcus sp.]|nr:hypothetical protein [Ruminococcus sp.]
QGKVSEGPQATGEGTQIGTSKFNEQNNDNKYVGYFYEQDQVHGLKESSTIYTYLNDWFESSGLKSEQYYNKIDINAGFCNDRQPSSSQVEIDGNGGTRTAVTYYGAYIRIRPAGNVPTATSTTVNPTLKCSNYSDLYTYIKAIQGNRELVNPVGLITVDEASFAGMVYGFVNQTSTNYLYTNMPYWTMTSNRFVDNIAHVFAIWTEGYISRDGGTVSYNNGVRPVINICSDVTLTGDGTVNSPYQVLD